MCVLSAWYAPPPPQWCCVISEHKRTTRWCPNACCIAPIMMSTGRTRPATVCQNGSFWAGNHLFMGQHTTCRRMFCNSACDARRCLRLFKTAQNLRHPQYVACRVGNQLDQVNLPAFRWQAFLDQYNKPYTGPLPTSSASVGPMAGGKGCAGCSASQPDQPDPLCHFRRAQDFSSGNTTSYTYQPSMYACITSSRQLTFTLSEWHQLY